MFTEFVNGQLSKNVKLLGKHENIASTQQRNVLKAVVINPCLIYKTRLPS